MKHYKEKIISFAISATLVMGMSAVSVSAETRDEYEYTVENLPKAEIEELLG